MAKSRSARKKSSGSKIDGGLIAIGGVTLVVIALVAGLIAFNQSATQATVENVTVDYPVGVNEAGQPFKGSPSAPIILEEFADFRCPHCADFYTDFKPLVDEFVKTGQVQLVFMNFPVMGQQSITAAQAVECALAQGPEAFWAYHDALFENRQAGDSLYTRASLIDVAEQLGLDSDAFTTCLNGNRQTAEVQKDIADGEARGVTGTPSLFLNGQRYASGRDTSTLRSTFEAMLDQ